MSATMPPRPAKPRPADHLRLVTATAAAAPAAGAAVLRPKAAAAAARSLGDWLWHGLGIGAATASAGFATYALIFSTGEVVPSGNFNVFARYDRLYQAPGAQHGDPDPATPADGRTETADRGGVDFAPTGSVAGRRAAQGDGAAPGAAASSRGNADGMPLSGFTLRDVFDGKALVESRSSLSVVRPGSVLAGAGEVLSIEKRGERWVVLTRNGLIAGQKR